MTFLRRTTTTEGSVSARLRVVRPDELERRLQERLDALGPAPRTELLHVLSLPDFDRADAIGTTGGTRDADASGSC